MLFVCLSSLDREKIVKPLLYHLYTFGFNIWYDHKKLFLSDTIDFDVYIKGIEECSDILIVYSKNLTKNSKCGRKELDVIYKLKNSKNIYPVMFETELNDYNGEDKELLSNTIHYKINNKNIYQVAIQIAIKIVKNLLHNFGINDDSITIPMKIYGNIPPFNLREKIISLLTLFETRQILKIEFNICNELNIHTILQYYYSLIKLKCRVSENDVKLLELLTILVVHCG